MDVTSWLRNLGLERYEAAFRENDVNVDVLRTLTAEDLKGLGVASIGHRRQLLMAIARLRDDTPQAARPTDDPLPPPSAGERRQLTVMFCDLVDSAALGTKLDPEELRDLLHTYRTLCGEVIARYDGFAARYVGDGILIYFGWPAAHEDDAERAVRAALEIVQSIRQASSNEILSVRIGIATGPVVVGEPAGTGDQAKLAVGSTPNLAARLQGLATADKIVIAASTRRLIGNAFGLSDLGEHDLKGIAEPVHAWLVHRVTVTESRFDARHGLAGLTPLVGREEEVDLLLRRWSQAQDGEGQVVVLGGEPGIGKSRILNTLRERLETGGVQALRFQCSPYFVNSAFWPIIDNFERTLRFTRDETPEARLDKLEALIVTQYGLPLADIRFVASILSLPCEDRYGVLAMTPQRYKDETLRTLVDIWESAARQQPSVLLFEDVHWADPTTLEVLDLLIDRVKTIPLLVVLTHRPEFVPRWSGQGHVGAINLSKLTRAQSAAMVSALAGGKALPTALLEQILTRTDGVPLFVEELTKAVLESSGLKDAGDHYEYGGPARSMTVPATLRDSLMARLDRFMPVKEIAQIGATIGREFSYELIAAVAPMSQAQLDDALMQLCESGLALRRGTPPDALYTFKHALVQDAAYDSLLKSRRQELHAKIARVIETRFPEVEATEPEVLAHHYTEAKRPEAAIPLWQKAGSLALKQLALNEAIIHLNKGLELVATLPSSAERDAWELDLRSLLGAAWTALGGWYAQEVWDSLHPALKLAHTLRRGDALLSILFGHWSNVLTRGRLAESLHWVAQIQEAAEAYRDHDLRILMPYSAQVSYFLLGRHAEAREHGNQLLANYTEERFGHVVDVIHQDPKTVALCYNTQSTWMLGYPEQAMKISDATDAHARRRGHPFDLGFWFTIGALIFDYLGDPEELLKRTEEAERLGHDNSLPVLTQVLVPIHSAIALIRQGRFAEGTASLQGGLAALEEGGGRVMFPCWKSALAEGMAQLGDLEGALHLIEEIIAQVERPGWEERSYYAETLRLKGWMLSLKEDVAGSEHSFIASLDWARRQQAKSWELRTATSLARLWQSQGKRQDAYDLLAPVYGWFTEGFGTKDLRNAKALLAELR
ncbi:MAG: AAA family ATPase [Rhodopila sp.]